MLTITIPEGEFYNDQKKQFVTTPSKTLNLEHSLISLSKWEAKHHKPFLANNSNDAHTVDDDIDYIRCMTLTKNVEPIVYYAITLDVMKQVNEYIQDPMTATVIRRPPGTSNKSSKFVTSELIYYWMISCNIPFECEKWHLNRLLTLIDVCNASNSHVKMNPVDVSVRNQALNEQRKKELHTTG